MTNDQLVAGTYEFVIERKCRFKAQGIKPGNKKKTPGCAHCGLAMDHLDHLGAPPTMNNHSIERQNFNKIKATWQHACCLGIIRSGMPRGLQAVTVEIIIGFEEYRATDEGNRRWMPEKSLGDALVNGYGYRMPKKKGQKKGDWVQVIDGGWIPDDSFWPIMRYSVGNLQGVHTPGESWMRVIMFPSTIEPTPAERVERSRVRVKLDADVSGAVDLAGAVEVPVGGGRSDIDLDRIIERSWDINPFAAVIDA